LKQSFRSEKEKDTCVNCVGQEEEQQQSQQFSPVLLHSGPEPGKEEDTLLRPAQRLLQRIALRNQRLSVLVETPRLTLSYNKKKQQKMSL